MDYLIRNIALNLKRIRKVRKMSLEYAAEQTGVSKSMLAQIERGEANPTIGILERIAGGMRVSFDSLIAQQETDGYTIERKKMTPVRETEGQYRIFNCLPFEGNRNIEWYVMEIEPGRLYHEKVHEEGTSEYIEVNRGVLSISIESKEFVVAEGDFFCFQADREHTYCNPGDEKLIITVFMTRG